MPYTNSATRARGRGSGLTRNCNPERAGKKGTGLGLFIAHGVIDAHGGKLWVETDPGQGARFFFTLPTAARA